MPAPVQTWVTGTPITATSLDLALYTADGTADNPQGIAFHATRPLLVESYVTATTLPASSGGTQTSLAGSLLATPGSVIYDTAGYFGQYSDQPAGTGYYQFLAAIKGSAGDGQTPGGWMLLSHFAAIAAGTHLTSVSADLLGTAQTPVSGTRQAPSSTQDSTAFFLDLVNVGPSVTWTPAVTVAASSGTASLVVNATDSSGETCRFCALWASVSATSAGAAFFPNASGSPYPFTVPQGVTQLTVTPIGAGGGGGGGASGANEQGGGGGGGGELASGTINVTPQGSYTVVVGAGGTPGTGGSGTGSGTAGTGGGLSEMAGDGGSQVIAHGGSGGAGATNAANGTGGAGGTGSSASTHHPGGAGASGKTAVYGGGGGSSAGTSAAGNAATSASGAPAPSGGGPGGAGGTQTISILQNVHASAAGRTLTVKFQGLQAGNTVICFVYAQATAAAGDPTVTLSDGTPFGTPAQTADVTSNQDLNNAVYILSGVAGGETSLTISATGTNSGAAILAQVYEVSGLGPSPQTDVATSHTQGPSHPDNDYESSPSPGVATTHAPDLWVAMTGAQQTSGFTIYKPPNSQGWNTDSPQYVHASRSGGGTVYGGLMTAWQTQNKPGTMFFANIGSKGFSAGVSKGTIAVAFTTSAMTTGNNPVIGPGGGGGAGLGASNNGGAGYDGQVTLGWTSPSGSGYGTPALPAPFTGYSQSTALGTTATATVNVNGPQGIRDVVNFLSNPPAFRIAQTAAAAIPASAITPVPFTGASPAVDSYSGWTAGTYTAQRTGLYLFHGLACFSAAPAGLRMAAVTVNGTTYWGPPSAATSAGTCNAAKTQVLDLHKGDTVSFAAYQTTTGSLNLAATDQTRFLLVFLCELGVPQGNWSPPDTTFRWSSGMRGEALGGNLSALQQQHFGNDLGFLVNRPYFTGYQAIAQTALTAGAFTTVTLDQVQGIIHGADNGDNYNGWDGTSIWAAPEPGWYLAVGEVFTSAPSTTGCTVTAALLPTTSGGAAPSQSPDIYQQLAPSTAFGGGAALVGMQYLGIGESVSLQVRASGYSAPYQTIVGTHSGGVTASALSLTWMSE